MTEDGAPEDAEAVVCAYYDAIDADEYDRFADLLAPDVVHDRPDRTIEGRAELVGFMREDRPQKDTTHEILAVYGEGRTDAETSETTADEPTTEEAIADETIADEPTTDEATRDEASSEGATAETASSGDAAFGGDAAAEGRLLDSDGDPVFGFVDAFALADGEGDGKRITRIRTYAR